MLKDIKNPFGLRNGIHITVNDLREDERGLACNCVCPLCKDPFEARLGKIRVHHFAHSGEGCNEVAAYLMGLYGFFVDFLKTHAYSIPELNVYYSIDKKTYIPVSLDSLNDQFWLHPRAGMQLKKISVTGEIQLRFESADIITSNNGRPEVVIASYHGKRIAFVITPPDSVCKDYYAKPYKDIATLEIRLSNKADLISRANTEMMNVIFSDPKNYAWISSPAVDRVFAQINEERQEAFREYQLELEKRRIQQEEERKKQEELILREKERLRQEQIKQQKKQEEREKQKQIEARKRKEREKQKQVESKQREEEEKQRIAEQLKIPGLVVKDSYGNRWIQCEICGKIATDSEFWSYQVNRGKCNECLRRKRNEKA